MKFTFREPGLPASVALHGAVLLAGVISFSSPKPFADAQEAIAVEVVDESALREVMKGERQAKPQPTPTARVDRVDDRKEQNAPGVAARQVNTDATPKPQEATAKDERKEVAAAVPPPPPMPRIVPPAPPKPPEPPKPAEPPKPVAAKPVAAVPPKPAESTEEEDEAEEIIRQAARKKAEDKKAEEQKRLEDQRRAEERRKADEQRRQDVAKQEAAKQEAAKQEQARQEQLRQEQAEARQRDEQRRQAEAKAAQDLKKAEDAKKAQEAARKAADERRKREAEQAARNQATAEAARRALLASREAPQNAGNTGAQVSRIPSQGTPTATGQRLNPSERGQLVGMIADQIRSCWNVPVSGKPAVLPQVRVALNQDGSLGAQPTLINSSGDPLFRAVADSGMRAIRQCSPFRIPARFAPMYQDWRSLIVQLNPDD